MATETLSRPRSYAQAPPSHPRHQVHAAHRHPRQLAVPSGPGRRQEGHDQEGHVHDHRRRRTETRYAHGGEGQHGLVDSVRGAPPTTQLFAAIAGDRTGTRHDLSRRDGASAARARPCGAHVARLGAPRVRRHHLPAHFGGHGLLADRSRPSDLPHRERVACPLAARDRSLGGCQRPAYRDSCCAEGGAGGGTAGHGRRSRHGGHSVLPGLRGALDRDRHRQSERRRAGVRASTRTRLGGVLLLRERRLDRYPASRQIHGEAAGVARASADAEMERRRRLTLVRYEEWPARAGRISVRDAARRLGDGEGGRSALAR